MSNIEPRPKKRPTSKSPFVRETASGVLDKGETEAVRAHLQAVAAALNELASPARFDELVDALGRLDHDRFHQVIEPLVGLGLTCGELCRWLTPRSPRMVEVCRIRDDLTAEERFLVSQILRRHGALAGFFVFNVHGVTGFGFATTPVPPGPLLDELRANGLVTCVEVQETVGEGEVGLRCASLCLP